MCFIHSIFHDKFQIGLFWALGVAAEVIFFYFHSKVLSRLDAEVILKAAFGIGVIRFVLIAFLPITSVLIVAQLMHAGTFAAHHSAATKLLQRWFTGPVQARGQALMATISYRLGGTLGGLCAGWIWEASQPRYVCDVRVCIWAGGYGDPKTQTTTLSRQRKLFFTESSLWCAVFASSLNT
nr:MFS transporter [Polynucleobacter necessarius]